MEQTIQYLTMTITDTKLIDIDDMRKAYLEVIGQTNWKTLLLEVAVRAKNRLSRSISNSHSSQRVIASLDEKKTVFENPSVLTIGRNTGCDIRCTDMTVSRLHAVIYFLEDRIVVVDPGSLSGIKTSTRQKTHTGMRILQLSVGQNFGLLIGNKKVQFQLEPVTKSIMMSGGSHYSAIPAKRTTTTYYSVFPARSQYHYQIPPRPDCIPNHYSNPTYSLIPSRCGREQYARAPHRWDADYQIPQFLHFGE